jgi:amino acid adenylation domain-containing protein
MSQVPFDPFAGGEILVTVPTTGPQREIWLAIRLGGREANLAYNESLSLELRGALDVSALTRAVQMLVLRHEALRSTFTPDGEFVTVLARTQAELRIEDLSSLPGEARAARAREVIREEMTTEFDLVQGPLFRPRLIVFGEQHCELVLTAHHLVCDGWSTGVLVSELPKLYDAARTGAPLDLEEAPRFSDHALEWRQAPRQSELARAERYWVDVLKSPPAPLDLPTDKPRPLDRQLHAGREDRVLPPALLASLRALAKRLNVSMAALLLAAFDTLLERLTGQSELVVAMPMAGQAESGAYSLVGHCVNTVPLRLSLDPNTPFAEHAAHVKRAILDASDHQSLSFGDLLRKIELPRDASRAPLASVIFNVDPEMQPISLGGVTASYRTNARVSENFELFLNCSETQRGLVLELTYSSSLFEATTAAGWLAEYEVLLGSVVAAPETPCARLRLLPEAELHHLLEGVNETRLELPPFGTALQLIEAQAQKTPQNVAVRDARRAFTYAELDQQANQLAHELRRLGVQDGDAVGVALARTALLPVVLLGVWKAGAAYIPLDPEYPATRLEYILKDTAARVLLTDQSSADILPHAPLSRVVVSDALEKRPDAPARSNEPSALAYVIHTSGSTGQPKGVQIEQRSFLNMLVSLQAWPGLVASDVLVAVTTLSFDMAGVELFLPLSVGAQVVVAPRDTTMDGRALAALLEETSATVMQATPVTWRLLVESGWQGSSTFKAFTGGEPLAPDLAKALLARTGELWNLYGPTETTVYATGTRIDSEGEVTIGRPVANTTGYILDAHLQPVPRGARGELYVGGAAVARGYQNRPDLTAERFLPDPFGVQGSRVMYRTGDLAHYDTRGRIVYDGRNDHQVKVRGFRIELGEIEACLSEMPAVRQGVVAVREVAAGDQRLVAYVVREAGAQVDLPAVQTHVRAKLPAYMVPHHLVTLGELPVTPNGKIDRKALPAPGEVSVEAAHVAPRTETERKLATIWQEYLRVGRVGVTDGFFELGGHSMLAVRMLSRIRETFGVELPIRSIFQAQSVEALSLMIDAKLIQSSAAPASTQGMEEIEF